MYMHPVWCALCIWWTPAEDTRRKNIACYSNAGKPAFLIDRMLTVWLFGIQVEHVQDMFQSKGLELPDPEVFASAPENFRMRAEFRVWHEVRI